VQIEIVAASLPRHMAALSRLYVKLHYYRATKSVAIFPKLVKHSRFGLRQ
jgi:hypothetical protein